MARYSLPVPNGDLRSCVHAFARHFLILHILYMVCAGTLIIIIFIICILFQTNGQNVCAKAQNYYITVDIELIFVLFFRLLLRSATKYYFIFGGVRCELLAFTLLFFDSGTLAAGFYRISQTIVYQNMLKLISAHTHTHTKSE